MLVKEKKKETFNDGKILSLSYEMIVNFEGNDFEYEKETFYQSVIDQLS